MFLGLELAASAAFLIYFTRTFDIPALLVAVHLPLWMLLRATSLLVPALLLLHTRLRRRHGLTPLIGLSTGLVAAAVWLLYLADFVSNLEMGSNITYKLVALWFADWRLGGNLLSLSPRVTVALAGLTIAVLGLHVAWSWRLRAGVEALVLPSHPTYVFATSRRASVTVATVAVVLVAYGLYGQLLYARTSRSELLSSDPILAFLRESVDVFDDSYLAGAARLREEEPRIRTAYPKGRPFARKHVIVVIVDSLRADHMSLYGYGRPTTPFLSSLHASGSLKKIEFATSACAESNCGILATLFSKGLRRQIPENFGLYHLLKDQGYAVNFILSGNHDWRGLREVYGQEQTLYFDGRQSQRFNRSDDRVIFEGLERVPHATGPAFFFVHLMSPHLIGTKQERFRIFTPSDVTNDWNALFGGAYDRETVVNNYDNGVTQADAIIKDLFAALSAKGYLDDSVVVVTSDHGEALGGTPREGYGHITSLYQELIRIPLLVYDTSSATYANLEFATQVDIAPTIVDRLGLPVPESWEGISLMRPLTRDTTFHQTALKTPKYAIVHRSGSRLYKYHYSFLGRREAVYDLTADPGELANIRDTVDPGLLSRLRSELARFRNQ